MVTILVIILIVNRPNFVHFRTVNAQKPSPKGEAAAWSVYSWIRACVLYAGLLMRPEHSETKAKTETRECKTKTKIKCNCMIQNV